MIVLDANVLIAVLDGSDAHHGASIEIFRSHASERLIVHPLTLAETLVQPSRAGVGVRARDALDRLGIRVWDTPDDPLELAALRADSGLRMPDCCVLGVALQADTALATFDRRLAETARARGVRVV